MTDGRTSVAPHGIGARPRVASVLALWLQLAYSTAPVLAVLKLVVSVVAAVARPLTAVGAGLVVQGLSARDPLQVHRGLWLIAVAIVMVPVDKLVELASFFHEDLAERYVRHRVMHLVASIPTIAHHQDPQVADVVGLLRTDARQLGSSAEVIARLLGSLAAAISVAAVLATVSPVALLLLPLALLVASVDGRAARRTVAVERRMEWVRRRGDTMLQLLRDPDHGVEIRCGAAAPAAIAAMDEALLERQAATVAVLRSSRVMRIGVRLLFVGGIALALISAAASLRGSGGVGVSGVVVLIMIIPRLSAVAEGVSGITARIVRGWAQVSRMQQLQDYAERERAAGDGPAPARLTSPIVLQGVGYTYPGASSAALQDVSLSLAPGSVVALVGENGAGKSTLVALLAGLSRPTHGEISVQGRPLAELDPVAWRSRLTAALQDTATITLRLGTTVGIGRLDDADRLPPDEVALDALLRAQAGPLLQELPDGLDTQLGRQFAGGTELSGGQWQRVAIARGLTRDLPLLLLFDEPTSALDPVSEQQILDNVLTHARAAAARVGAIGVIVSHRMSTVRRADRIVVLHDGRIDEDGTHEELIALNGRYAELFGLQARSYR